MKKFIVDTNTLLVDPFVTTLLTDQLHTLVILKPVIDEVDKFKSDPGLLGFQARSFSKELEIITKICDRSESGYYVDQAPPFVLQLDAKTHLQLHRYDRAKSDDAILACTEIYNLHRGEDEIYLVSHDTNLRIQAEFRGIPTINPADWIKVTPKHFRLPLTPKSQAVESGKEVLFSTIIAEKVPFTIIANRGGHYKNKGLLSLEFDLPEKPTGLCKATFVVRNDMSSRNVEVWGDQYASQRTIHLPRDAQDQFQNIFLDQWKIGIKTSRCIDFREQYSMIFSRLTIDLFVEPMTETELLEYNHYQNEILDQVTNAKKLQLPRPSVEPIDKTVSILTDLPHSFFQGTMPIETVEPNTSQVEFSHPIQSEPVTTNPNLLVLIIAGLGILLLALPGLICGFITLLPAILINFLRPFLW